MSDTLALINGFDVSGDYSSGSYLKEFLEYQELEMDPLLFKNVIFYLNNILSRPDASPRIINKFCSEVDFSILSDEQTYSLAFAMCQAVSVLNKYTTNSCSHITSVDCTDNRHIILYPARMLLSVNNATSRDIQNNMFNPWILDVQSRMHGQYLCPVDVGVLKFVKERLHWLIRSSHDNSAETLSNLLVQISPSFKLISLLHPNLKKSGVWKLFLATQNKSLQSSVATIEMPIF